MRTSLRLAAATGGLLLIGACGGGDDGPNAKRFDGQQKDVAAVIDDLQSASRAGEPERICEEVFTKELASTIKRETGVECTKRVGQQLVDEKATYKAEGVRLDGDDRAVVNVTDAAGTRSVLYMTKAGDDWRIAQIAR